MQLRSRFDHHSRFDKEQLSDESSVYHYTLVRRLRNSVPILASYVGVALIYASVCTFYFGLYHLFGMLLFIPVLYAVHNGILLILHRARPYRTSHAWRFNFHFPWIGVYPERYFPFPTYRTIQWHMCFLTFMLIGASFIWMDAVIWMHLCFIQLWLLLPRLSSILAAPGNDTSDLLIRIQHQEISYYKL